MDKRENRENPERRAPRILLVEDNPLDRLAVERLFAREALPYELVCAGTVSEAVEIHREDPPDLALLDQGLPDGTGLELQPQLDGVPCVFITGKGELSVAIQAMKSGAFDFLVKDTEQAWVELLPSVIGRALEVHRLREEVRRHTEELDELVIARTRELEEVNEGLQREVTERKQAEEALRESEYLLAESQRVAGLGSYSLDIPSGTWSSSLVLDQLFGIGAEYPKDVEGWLEIVHPDDRSMMRDHLATNVLANHERFDKAYRVNRVEDGAERWVHGLGELHFDTDGNPVHMFGTIQDITGRKQHEDLIALQAHRAEALLDLPRAAEELDEAAFLLRGLELAEDLTGSSISFIHFVDDDEETIELGVWSRRTLEHNCQVPHHKHHPVEKAGIWADPLRRREPAVFNDYAGYTHKHGLPEGHARLDRLMSVPVIENDRVVMLAGIANKATDYTDLDVETVRLISNEIWRIVQHNRGEEQLRRSEVIVSSSSDMLALVDTEYTYLAANPAYLKAFGKSYDELIGDRVVEVFGEEYFNEFIKPKADRCLGGARIHFRKWMDFPASGKLFMDISLHPYTNADNEVRGYVVSGRDITEIETARSKLREMNVGLERMVEERTEQLVAANKELEAFAYSVSHDLKAPLRAIDGYSGLLEERHESSLPEGGRRLLGEVRSSANQMACLIDDLLAFSGIGRADMALSEVDIRELAQAVFSELSGLEGDRTIEFSLGELPTIRADLALFRQVWTNLLQNALKFTRGREVARIEVDFQEEPGHWVFVVRDNGVGFDMAYVDKLFGVFQRLHNQDEFPGTGVGLATVQRIIHRHGGEVWAEGEVGAGATIFFRLPRSGHVT